MDHEVRGLETAEGDGAERTRREGEPRQIDRHRRQGAGGSGLAVEGHRADRARVEDGPTTVRAYVEVDPGWRGAGEDLRADLFEQIRRALRREDARRCEILVGHARALRGPLRGQQGAPVPARVGIVRAGEIPAEVVE